MHHFAHGGHIVGLDLTAKRIGQKFLGHGLHELFLAGEKRIAKESATRERLRNRELGVDFYGLRSKLKELGVEYIEGEE